MTALGQRRARRTVFGGIAAMVLTGVALALAVVGALTLRDSEEGEVVGAEERPMVAFPDTPNGVLAVTDDTGRLTSLVVVTVLPDDVGGSIVTVPVNADVTVGLGPARQPISSVFSADDPEGFGAVVESLLSMTVERVEVVGPARLAEIIDPLTPVMVELPEDVVDSDTFGSGIVVDAGPQTLRTSLAVDVLTAIDVEGSAYDHHDVDVEMWSKLAANAPFDTGFVVPAESESSGESGDESSGDADGEGADGESASLPAPESFDDLLARLFAGEVQVRDLDIDPGITASAENPDGVDFVVVDRRDSLLVFSQVSPSFVSAPNPGLAFRLEVRFSDNQLDDAGDEFTSRSQVARTLVGELLFFQANVVSVDPAPTPEGAPSVTRIEVAQERFVEELEEFAPLMFGESEVVVATTLLDGVDAVVKLGTGYLDGERGADGDTVVDDE